MLFLLRYLFNVSLRRQITTCTSVVKDYNRFADLLFFGKQGVITDNDLEGQEKRLKHLNLVVNAVNLSSAT
ncbi:Tn3 family transposase [Phormidium sp. FACHB-592]|uniref:Transposase n=1 Tax=Stenomitos frigidus AS-A4 TaxID=2933935 RepID=A0ABV0KTE7_9CYAN|nr:Tn3 family transposase [Phormidium sp. FACHB-592]